MISLKGCNHEKSPTNLVLRTLNVFTTCCLLFHMHDKFGNHTQPVNLIWCEVYSWSISFRSLADDWIWCLRSSGPKLRFFFFFFLNYYYYYYYLIIELNLISASLCSIHQFCSLKRHKIIISISYGEFPIDGNGFCSWFLFVCLFALCFVLVC